MLHVQGDERFRRDGDDILSEVSVSFVKAEEVTRVGTFDPGTGTVTVENIAALEFWLGGPLAPEELLTSEGRGRRRRELQEFMARPLSPTARRLAEREARKLGLR